MPLYHNQDHLPGLLPWFSSFHFCVHHFLCTQMKKSDKYLPPACREEAGNLRQLQADPQTGRHLLSNAVSIRRDWCVACSRTASQGACPDVNSDPCATENTEFLKKEDV